MITKIKVINTSREFVPKDTILLNIKTITEITEKEIEALRDINLWNNDLDIGIQRWGDKFGIVTKNDELKLKLYTNGLNVNGYLLQASTDIPMFVNVPLIGIPLEFPDEYEYRYTHVCECISNGNSLGIA